MAQLYLLSILSHHQRTPLYMAAEGGHMSIVEYLVNVKGANINIEDVFKVTGYRREC